MAKVVEMKPRAPAVASKLEAAREVLRELEQDVGQFALDAAEGVPGASKRLADLRTTIAGAQRDVAELEKALTVATRIDRQGDVAAVTAMRAEQFALFKKHGEARLKAMATVMDALATAAVAYSQYAIETNAMVVALPTGTRMSFMAMGRNGYAGSWVGDCKSLITGEAFRLTIADEHGRGARLPFATQPELSTDDHRTIVPAIDIITEAQESVLRDIEGQMNRLNAERMAQAAEAAA